MIRSSLDGFSKLKNLTTETLRHGENPFGIC